MPVPIKIFFELETGGEQILWGEVADWDKLRELQDYTTSPLAPSLVIPLYASLQKGGQVGPRVFPAHRVRIEEAE